ncbi:DUF3726 domain-containing protein [Marivita sp.]|uniref:DUF3726 domain-containing protein n=1 Tax=Marivita sp. TaxID=2003365 RepID=UPI00321C0779
MTSAAIDDLEPNDPTRSGPPLLGEDGAWLSNNEIEQLCLKAARGAGMSWGLAEEAGFAAAWLARRGIDGPLAVLTQLNHAQGRGWNEICPVVAPDRLYPADGHILCPIALGAALCDHGTLLGLGADQKSLRIGPVSHPILLLPFLSDLARTCGLNLRLAWPGGTVLLGVDGSLLGDVDVIGAETAFEAEISGHVGSVSHDQRTPQTRLVASDTLGGLNTYALTTTVPASDASRAGAGADDNE